MTAGFSVRVLGSGTSTGVPTLGCECPVCTSASPRNHRTRCSILLQHRGHHILIDTATDLRQQALREGISHIEAVLYTHAHADHVNGIDDLRAFSMKNGGAIPIHGNADTINSIRRAFRYIFDDAVASGYRPNLETHIMDGPLNLFGLTIQPVPLLHGRNVCLGYRIGPFAYLTDCHAIPADSKRLLQHLDTVIIDGLRFRPHTTHFNIPAAIEAMRELGVRRIILTHLNHDVDHEHHSRELPQDAELAYDGMRLEFAAG